jgi:hypothetical protein
MPSPVANLCRIDPAVLESSRLAGRIHSVSHRDGGAGDCWAGAVIAKALSSPALLVNYEPKPETRVSDTRFFRPTVPT